ncbi:MAG TPA: SGNH/GDSL hydrolase family protein [Gemmatimonadales bacterium]
MRRALVRNLLAVTVATVASLLLADLALWIVAPAPYRSVVQVHSRGPDAEPVVYERNAYGFRSMSMRTRRKPDNTVRVVVIGASTTDEAVRNTRDTWAGMLEARLRNRFAGVTSVEVAAFGRGGLTVLDNLLWARTELEQFEPDVVVTLLGINDLAWHGGPAYDYRGIPEVGATRASPGLGARVKHSCQLVSQLCRRIRLLRVRLVTDAALREGRAIPWDRENFPRLREEYRALPPIDSLARDPDPFVEFSDGIEALLELLRKRLDVETVVMGQPVLWQAGIPPEQRDVLWFSVATPGGPVRPSPGWLEAEMARYNARQEAVSARFGAAYINLGAMIPQTLEYFYDDCHFTRAGDELVAAAVAPVVESMISRILGRAAGPAPAR